MRLITWNVARLRARLPDQAAALAQRKPDVVALQEVSRQTLPLWQHAFALMGMGHVRSSLEAAPGTRPRATAVVVASRGPQREVAYAPSVPRPESALWTAVETGDRAVEVLCLHVPNAANGWIKPQTLQAVRADLSAAEACPRIICGDLNTPRRERASGEVISFARDGRGRLRAERGTEWDEAELGVVPGLRELGYRDVYRALHGYGDPAPSWTWKRIAGHGGGWRLDHIFASPDLEPISCAYHYAWRDEGLSDHSALEADLE
jgi:exonuclease III